MKSLVIEDYSTHMSYVDRSDQISASYGMARCNCQWDYPLNTKSCSYSVMQAWSDAPIVLASWRKFEDVVSKTKLKEQLLL